MHDLNKNLKDEKRYFQMELLNRENNFNKIFNNAPNIGVINPLNANTKVNLILKLRKKKHSKNINDSIRIMQSRLSIKLRQAAI